MIPNFGTRLGQMLAEKIAERFKSPSQPETAPAPESAPPTTDAAAPTEAAPADSSATAADSSTAPAAEPVQTTPEPVAAQPAGTTTPTVDSSSAAAPAAPSELVAAQPAATQPAAAAPAAPEKSAEELEEERLWGEVDRAWAAEDFGQVTELLDRLKALQPEDAAEIDQKIAAAQYNAGAHFEQAGELARALYLYQDAQRRDPNLGEAGFAIERVQNQINAAAQPAPAEAPAPAETPHDETPTTQLYTVQEGDTLWAIAERFYGDGSQWNKIADANRDQLPNPDLIQPGQVLTIP